MLRPLHIRYTLWTFWLHFWLRRWCNFHNLLILLAMNCNVLTFETVWWSWTREMDERRKASLWLKNIVSVGVLSSLYPRRALQSAFLEQYYYTGLLLHIYTYSLIYRAKYHYGTEFYIDRAKSYKLAPYRAKSDRNRGLNGAKSYSGWLDMEPSLV